MMNNLKDNMQMLDPKEAIDHIGGKFPFPEYMSRMYDRRNAYLNTADTVRRYLQPGAKILDFGSGPCDKTAVLQAMGYQCTAWDDLQDDWHKLHGNREKILDFARSIGIDFRLADPSNWKFEPESFDMVMLHDVIEHLHDSPRDLLNDLVALCRPGGYLFVTVPNAANIRKRVDVLFGRTNYSKYELFYWYPGPWRGHVREYVRNDLLQLASHLGIEPLEVRGCDHMLMKVPKKLQRLYLAVSDCFDGFKDSWTLVAKKPAGWRPRESLSREDLNSVLCRTTTYKY